MSSHKNDTPNGEAGGGARHDVASEAARALPPTPEQRYLDELRSRILFALIVGLLAYTVSTLGYYALGCAVGKNARFGKSLFSLSDDEWTWYQCVYLTGITLTTVGYTDELYTDNCLVYTVDTPDGAKSGTMRTNDGNRHGYTGDDKALWERQQQHFGRLRKQYPGFPEIRDLYVGDDGVVFYGLAEPTAGPPVVSAGSGAAASSDWRTILDRELGAGTHGFGSAKPAEHVAWAYVLDAPIRERLYTPYTVFYTVFNTVVGMGFLLYVVSAVTAFFVEGGYQEIQTRRKMMKAIDAMNNHYIVCGAGSTGIHVIGELNRTGRQFVVLEQNQDILDNIRLTIPNLVFLTGDASDDTLLRRAGIERAAGIISALPTDKDNLVIIVTARQLNPKIRVVARGVDPAQFGKLTRAGQAENISVVSPNFIGALRMTSEMIRPSVVTFLDKMLRAKGDEAIRFEGVRVHGGSELVGKTLAEADLFARTGLHAVAVAVPNLDDPGADEVFHYNPPPTQRLEVGYVIIVIGDISKLNVLRELCNAPLNL